MIDEEGLVRDVDKGIEKNNNALTRTIEKIDKVITAASSNVLCYLLLFVFMVLALLYKLSK